MVYLEKVKEIPEKKNKRNGGWYALREQLEYISEHWDVGEIAKIVDHEYYNNNDCCRCIMSCLKRFNINNIKVTMRNGEVL